MDWVSIKGRLADFLRKYRYAALVVLIGIVLMLIPGRDAAQSPEPEQTQPVQEQTDLAEKLADILSRIDGAGRVEVMLTVAEGEETIYRYDEDITSGENGSIRKDTVIITNADRGQSGLVQQINPPKYRGAIIVCQGADSAAVRLSIIQAVSGVTGLGADKICVLKMK